GVAVGAGTGGSVGVGVGTGCGVGVGTGGGVGLGVGTGTGSGAGVGVGTGSGSGIVVAVGSPVAGGDGAWLRVVATGDAPIPPPASCWESWSMRSETGAGRGADPAA